MYPTMADTADKEGFPEIAAMYRNISVAEVFHGNRYRQLLENIENGEVFKRTMTKKWRCRNCGYIHESTQAPELCPACLHTRAHFEIAAENF